jgi:hypothetical protein
MFYVDATLQLATHINCIHESTVVEFILFHLLNYDNENDTKLFQVERETLN